MQKPDETPEKQLSERWREAICLKKGQNNDSKGVPRSQKKNGSTPQKT